MSIDHGSRSRLALYLDLIRWDRPAGTYLLLWPTLSALWIAAGGFPGWRLVVVFVLGTFLMRSAGCASTTSPTASSTATSSAPRTVR
jgi:4-hydroxybenzoate polyprenyltransferase